MNIKELLAYWWKYNSDEIAENSLSDCHVRGLNSIMFLNKQGQRIRLFITDPEHHLHTIHAVAFHTHRYDITIEVLSGELRNVCREFVPDSLGSHKRYTYRSCILDGAGSFDLTSDEPYGYFTIDDKIIRPGHELFLEYHKRHTVVVPENMVTAWLIYESTEDPEYLPIVYSDSNIQNLDLSKLYNPISREKIEHLLNECGILETQTLKEAEV